MMLMLVGDDGSGDHLVVVMNMLVIWCWGSGVGDVVVVVV